MGMKWVRLYDIVVRIPRRQWNPVSKLPRPNYLPKNLIDSNPFLFRVYTPKEASQSNDSTEPYFTGQLFTDDFSSSAFRSTSSPSPYRSPSTCTYADVAQHMDWTTKSSSPYVSTSFSFAWAIWEATRRYHHSMKHSVEIAVIDAKALSGRAVTAVDVLAQAAPKDRHKDHWKWYRFALEAQDVLVWGYIPSTAVLASIPLTQILNKVPSYLLSPDSCDAKDSPLSRLGWDYANRKPSYRQFCQDLSERFLRMPVDRRLRDTTAGAVRLALCFLHPWFHHLARDDFTAATATACELALVIARWPGQWWVREHPEIRDLVRCMVHIVGEEAREARRVQALMDAARMQEIVGGLEQLARSRQAHTREHPGLPSLPLTPEKSVRALENVDVEKHDQFGRAPQLEAGPPMVGDVAPALRSGQGSESESSSLEYFVRTASCFLTGFFLGSLVTLCILSSHRREIAHFT
ncbi:hypothetical protein A0H81_03164 [Grifola frondosa]|uniref:DUF7587 domain-containing protein n=1 Tax=Grifola frondosa TaxID=5627 RepID=A0A1C7MHV5_GRIFR|nr:hypothetical protein A0H81_03164 [Grifola frondosa]